MALGLTVCVCLFLFTFVDAKIETLSTIDIWSFVVAVFTIAVVLYLKRCTWHFYWKVTEFAIGLVLLIQQTFLYEFVEPIQDALAHGLCMAFVVLNEVERGIQDVCSYLWDMFRRGIEKAGFVFPDEAAPSEQEVYTKHISKKAVLLVSLPYGKSYDAMKAEITVDSLRPPFIDWQGNKKSDIPSLTKLKTSVRHFALCIVPLEAWDDPTKSLRQKFAYGYFWELIGPDPRLREGECTSWKPNQIERIDAMIEIGVITHSDDYVTEQFYKPLKNAWGKYEVVWWNSFDFAIRLAYLLKYSIPAWEILTDCRHVLETRRTWEGVLTRENASWTRMWFGAGAFTTFCCLTTLTPIGPIPVLASWIFCAGNMLDGFAEDMRGEPSYMQEWRKKSQALEREIPQLRGLVEY